MRVAHSSSPWSRTRTWACLTKTTWTMVVRAHSGWRRSLFAHVVDWPRLRVQTCLCWCRPSATVQHQRQCTRGTARRLRRQTAAMLPRSPDELARRTHRCVWRARACGAPSPCKSRAKKTTRSGTSSTSSKPCANTNTQQRTPARKRVCVCDGGANRGVWAMPSARQYPERWTAVAWACHPPRAPCGCEAAP